MVARNKIVVNGTLGSANQEVWSTGIHVGFEDSAVVTDVGELTAWAQACMDAWSVDANYTALRNCMGADAAINTITVQYFDASNVLVQSGESDPDPSPGLGAIRGPFQSSCVMSLRTGRPGRSYRGRCYWPALGAQLASTGAFAGTTTPANIVAAFVTLLADWVNAAPSGINPQPAVYSPTLDILTSVSSVQVGSVPDTQRRRRDNLPELYSSATYPPP